MLDLRMRELTLVKQSTTKAPSLPSQMPLSQLNVSVTSDLFHNRVCVSVDLDSRII